LTGGDSEFGTITPEGLYLFRTKFVQETENTKSA
jgi:hypothetical protein